MAADLWDIVHGLDKARGHENLEPSSAGWELNRRINKAMGYYTGFGANPATVREHAELISSEVKKAIEADREHRLEQKVWERPDEHPVRRVEAVLKNAEEYANTHEISPGVSTREGGMMRQLVDLVMDGINPKCPHGIHLSDLCQAASIRANEGDES